MTGKLNRRDFLRILTAGIGTFSLAQILAACGIKPTAAATQTLPTEFLKPAFTSTQAATSQPAAETIVPTETVERATATSAPAYLAVARGGDDPEALVRAAVNAIGGIQRFVPSGAKVVIKPNICTSTRPYKYAATTNPFLVAGLVKMALEAGAGQVLVLDYPFYGTSTESYADSGIQEQVEAAGGTMHITSKRDNQKNWVDYAHWIRVDLPNAIEMKSFEMIDVIRDADVLINVPVAKTHDTTMLTLGLKNLMGVVHDRPGMHTGHIHTKIAELASWVKPTLTVIDAVRILAANGPRGTKNLSEVKKLDTVIASADIVAADTYAVSLFGLEPDHIKYISEAAKLGVGTNNLSGLNIAELTL